MALTTTLFYVTALLAILAAVRVVTAQYVFRSALWLAVCLASLAVQFLLLHAEFVAVVQIMVYVGAVIILLIFAVMLTAQMGDANISQTNRLGIPAALGAALVGWKLYEVLGATKFAGAEAAAAAAGAGAQEGNLVAIGKQLLGPGATYVYPFELIACILFTALVGAVLIARKDPE
jgi:NADH-quinone oxidoreductase subunit J